MDKMYTDSQKSMSNSDKVIGLYMILKAFIDQYKDRRMMEDETEEMIVLMELNPILCKLIKNI